MSNIQHVIIYSKEEHEGEEESISAQEMPDIMLVEEPKHHAVLVQASGFCRGYHTTFFFTLEEIKSREYADVAKDQEADAVPLQPLAAVELHENIIEYVAKQVTNEDKK